FNDRLTRVLRNKRAVITVAVLLSVTTLGFLLIQGNARGNDTTLVLLCGVLTGIASGFYALVLMDVICFTEIDAIIVACVVGNVVSALMRLVPSFMGPLPSMAVIAALPLLSVLCVHAAVRYEIARDAARAEATEAKAKTGPSVPEPPKPDDGDKRRLLRIATAMLLFGLLTDFSREVCLRMSAEGGFSEALHAVGTWTALFALLIVGVVFMQIIASPGKHRITALHRAILVIGLLGVMLFAAAGNGSPRIIALSYAASEAAFQTASMLMIIIVCVLCHYHHEESFVYNGIYRAAWVAGPFLGMQLARSGIASGAVRPDSLALLAIPLGMTLLLALIFILGEQEVDRIMTRGLSDRRLPYRERCALIGKYYGLSDREVEIMALFGKGRDSAYIQETLVLSKSTVSTHRQHIYQKLGIHSQQELIDLIQNTQEIDPALFE
ncbi:MAG: hypothetical protein IJH83_06150, partial [Coriobacteriales bacterium]|nr:hypothetical protein [Coriobacteriales bacterium]